MQLNLETDRRYFLSKDIKTIIVSNNDKVKAKEKLQNSSDSISKC